MKLLYCKKCGDVVRLDIAWRHCMCCLSGGRYLEDKKRAQISGPCVPLGFSDTSFFRAIDKQPPHGSVFFDAFVIGKDVKTITHIACGGDAGE